VLQDGCDIAKVPVAFLSTLLLGHAWRSGRGWDEKFLRLSFFHARALTEIWRLVSLVSSGQQPRDHGFDPPKTLTATLFQMARQKQQHSLVKTSEYSKNRNWRGRLSMYETPQNLQILVKIHGSFNFGLER
jgi:hypothetical protein